MRQHAMISALKRRLPHSELLMLIHEDWVAHNRSWTRPGFQAIAVYRVGHWRLGLPTLWRKPIAVLYRVLYVWVRNVYGIELQDTTTVGRRVVIAHQGNVIISPHAVIGDDCLIRHNVTIGARRHEHTPDEVPRLGHRVQIGAGAVILGTVTIGDGAEIGANAVVVMSVPAGAKVFAPRSQIIAPSKMLQADPVPQAD